MSGNGQPSGRVTVYEGKIFRVVQEDHVFGEEIKTFEHAQRAPGVRLIVPTDDKILLMKEFRHERNSQDIRLPGGKVFDTLHDFTAALDGNGDVAALAEAAGRRELAEETGLTAEVLRLVHRSVCGATVDWDLYYFIVDAFDMAESGQMLESGENIEPFWVERREAEAMCLDGCIGEERSALILLRYLKGKLQ